MQTQSTNLIELAHGFLAAVSRGDGQAMGQYYHPSIEQIEYPNTLTRNGATRNLQALHEASEKGKKVLLKQHYEVVHSYLSGNTVIIEAIWTGTLAIPLGIIPAGGEMKAYFAQFYEFEDGKIIRQRNYDCFEPF